jgi:hypothetical protein
VTHSGRRLHDGDGRATTLNTLPQLLQLLLLLLKLLLTVAEAVAA